MFDQDSFGKKLDEEKMGAAPERDHLLLGLLLDKGDAAL